MNRRCWAPRVTVATVIEQVRNHRHYYLLVKEKPETQVVFNQPAGHLEEGESLIAAAVRETLEETGREAEITGYLGVYRFITPGGTTFLRHGFIGKTILHHPQQALDEGIMEAVWMSYEEICQRSQQMRSPMVIQLIDDFRSGRHYPLSILHE